MERIKLTNIEGFLLRELFDKAFLAPSLEKDSASGVFAWASMLSAILAYEIYAIRSKKIETLTKFFWRVTEKPILGNVFTGVWLGLTFHLLIEKSLRKTISTLKD